MNDLFGDPPPTLAEMITEVEREIGMRERVYPKWVAAGKMKSHDADRRIAVMRAVADKLRALA